LINRKTDVSDVILLKFLDIKGLYRLEQDLVV